MAIAWVQGASAYGSLPPPEPTINITPTAGDCLVLSVGVAVTGNPIFWGATVTSVTDTRGNIWTLACQSPPQYNYSAYENSSQLWTFVALNVAPGATTITINANAPWNVITVDEYSGVASVSAVDARSFNSIPYGSGLSSVDSLSIPINGTEMVYSAGFADTQSETLTASSGFTPRQTISYTSGTIASFDKLLTGGTADNVITASSLPLSLHVVILALSATPVTTSKILQIGYGFNFSPAPVGTVAAIYPRPNTLGRLLILIARVSGTGWSASDSGGNTWVVPVQAPSGVPNLVMGYCMSAKAGANTVTLTRTGGGSDVSNSMLVIEYDYQGAAFTSSSWGQATPGASVNTGSIAAASGDLLVSSFWAGDWSTLTYPGGVPPVGSSPQTWRYQYSDTGLYNEAGVALALADQVAPSSGSYSNTFTPNTSIDDLVGAILGFQLPDVISLACPINNGGQIGQFYSGQLIVTGGVAPFTFSIISGSLPPGLSLNSMTGLISGTPTTAGSYPYEAQVTDSLGAIATANCIITIPNSGLSSGAMASCGCMPSVEVTRDIDADWSDEDTFYITQDQPFPFTLRGIVLRMSYEND